ncbi:MAG: deoxyribose-phosphate aldolase [Vampirovibrionales bacterium]|nr:deoxyribose-phosphate aldolase [Vampirovibrionales bacterium]
MLTPATSLPLYQQLTRFVDHTWLPEWPFVGVFDLDAFCQQAIDFNCAGVCVRLPYIAQAKTLLASHNTIEVATVIGFPPSKVALEAETLQPTIGNAPLANKLAEIAEAKALGATELDIVWNVAQFLTGIQTNNTAETQAELKALMAAANAGTHSPVKLIIETDLLPPEALPLAAQLCAQAGVTMVKTCSGYVTGGQGATVPIIQAIRTRLDDMGAQQVGIKASGGIKTPQQAADLITAGATRLGMSQTQALG